MNALHKVADMIFLLLLFYLCYKVTQVQAGAEIKHERKPVKPQIFFNFFQLLQKKKSKQTKRSNFPSSTRKRRRDSLYLLFLEIRRERETLEDEE